MHAKFREKVEAATKGNAPIRTKVNVLFGTLNWAILMVQLKDMRFPSQLAKIPELLERDVAKPEMF